MTNDPPDPAITDVSVPDAITIGESFEVTVEGANYGGRGGHYSTISISSPSLDDSNDDDHVVVTDGTDHAYTNITSSGDRIYDADGNAMDARYILVEGGSDGDTFWSAGKRRSLSVEFTPEQSGTFVLNVRVTLPDDDDQQQKYTAPSSSTSTDQQDFPVRRYEVEVREEAEIDADLRSVDVDDGSFGDDGTVHAQATIENTGNREHTFFVGYTVYGPDGSDYDNNDTTGKPVSLEPGKDSQVYLSWDVESEATDGIYDAQVAAWKESDRDNLDTRLDNYYEQDAFEVKRTSIDGRITNLDPPTGTYSAGETVPTSVEVENTGTTDHTFFVGYTVYGPEGNEYDNRDQTGTAVSIAKGNRRWVDLGWKVPDDVPDGEYDVYVTVWKESDRDNLNTKLADERVNSPFSVETTADIAAEILDYEVEGGEYAPGESVPTTVTVENTGEADHTFFIGYTVYGPEGGEYDNDGETGTTVTIPKNDWREVNLNWVVPSDASTGRYDADIAVWKETHRDNLETELDRVSPSSVFEVVETKAAARIDRVSIEDGPYTEGQVVPTTASVTNSGEKEHTFFVGYTVFGPNGGEYDNRGTTGHPVTIPADETEDVDLEWQVTKEVPTGYCDAEVAVYAESERDRLETELDAMTRADVFEVKETLAAATIADIQPPDEPLVGDQTATFDIGVENGGETDHVFFLEVELLESETVVTGETIGQAVTVSSGDERSTPIEWQVPEEFPSGEYDLRVIVWSERDPENLQTKLAKRVRRDAVEVDNPEIAVSSLSFRPRDPITSFDTSARASLTLQNNGEAPVRPTVEHRILGPDEVLVASETETVDLPSGERDSVGFRWDLSRDSDLENGEYTYEVRVYSKSGEKLLTRRQRQAFRVDIPALGRTDFTIELLEATGEPVTDARVEMRPTNGGAGYTGTLRDGSIEFSDVPGGLYEVVVEHGEALLTESFTAFVGGAVTTQSYVMQPVGPITGSVVDSSEDQQVPEATVRLAGVEEVRTDGLGAYAFDTPVPDGDYDIVVESPDGSTIQKTVSVGPSRHVGLQTTRPLVPEDKRGQLPDSDVIGEENQLVTLIARYLQNSDDDNVILHYTDKAHGTIKGFVAGIVDFFEGLQAIVEILNLDLNKVVEALSALVDALMENPGETLIALGAAVIGSAIDQLEAIHEHQRQDNPFELPNPRAYSFMSGWYRGYIGFAILTSLIGGKVATTGAKMLKSSDRFVDAIDRVTSTVRRVNGDDDVSLTDSERNLLSKAPSDALNFKDGFDASGDFFSVMTIGQLLPDAPDSDFLRQMLKGAYYANHRNRGFLTRDDESPGYTDPFDGLWGKELVGGKLDTAVGRAMEMVYYGRAIETGFIDVHRIMSTFDRAKVPVGKRGIVASWKYSSGDDDFEVELDGVEVEMRQLQEGADPKPVVTKVREITTFDTGDAPSEVTSKKRELIREVVRRTEDANKNTPESGDLTGKAFVRGDWVDDPGDLLEMVWWDQTLEANREMVEETVKYIIRTDREDESNAIRSIFDPEATDD